MKTRVSVILILLSSLGYAQYANNSGVSYEVTKTRGDENILNSAGNIHTKVIFDSIGKIWNMPSENEYVRFKIFHEYLLDERKSGEKWKKEYAYHKTKMYERLEKVTMKAPKKKGYYISPKHENTKYEFVIFIKDISDNISFENYAAICRLIDRESGETYLEYLVKAKRGGGLGLFHGLVEEIINHLN